MALKLITPPTAEPITLEQAKAHLRVEVSDDDALIGALIVAAREAVESSTQRSLMLQTWELSLPCFPGAADSYAIRLPKAPLSSLASVKYVPEHFPYTITSQGQTNPADSDGEDSDCYWRTDTDDIFIKSSGTWGAAVRKFRTTLSSAKYDLDDHSEPARILPAFGATWPTTREHPNAVLVRYEAGYADADAVPAQIKAWMLLRIGSLYENRESTTGLTMNGLPFIDRMLDQYKIWGC